METFDAAGVTGIVWRRVKPGRERDAEELMRRIMTLARTREGYLGSEIFPPIPGVQDAYVVLYRFQSGARLREWLASPDRQDLIREIADFLAEPAVEFFFTHGRRQAGTASSVFAYRIRPDRREEFEDWRRRILAAGRKWEGFLGTESFDTLDGGTPEFIVVVRFDSRAHLDAWLRSDVRRRLIREVRAYVDRYAFRRIGTGFEGWFDFSEEVIPPARWRQGLLILSALFPVIMTMRLVLAPLFSALPLPVAFLILLVLDMALLTYLVMPFYSRWMRFWLQPAGDFTWREEARGWAVILGVVAISLVVFLRLGV